MNTTRPDIGDPGAEALPGVAAPPRWGEGLAYPDWIQPLLPPLHDGFNAFWPSGRPARTITIYTDVGRFQRSLAIQGGEEVHALVVTRDGTILARGAGDPQDREWDVVLAALRGA